MKQAKRDRPSGRDEVAPMERKIESGVKKRQAMSETLDSALTVKTGSATVKTKDRRK